MHQPLNSGNVGWVGVKENEQIKEILSKYPEAIIFSSHTHRDLDDSSVVLNQPFTMIHTGAIDYTIIPDASSEGGRRSEPYIKGLYIEVNGNNVVGYPNWWGNMPMAVFSFLKNFYKKS